MDPHDAMIEVLFNEIQVEARFSTNAWHNSLVNLFEYGEIFVGIFMWLIIMLFLSFSPGS
jgi:hypothetical protein